jgi:hypothetical protein
MAPEIKRLKIGENGVKVETAIIDGCKADICSLGITILSLNYPKAK